MGPTATVRAADDDENAEPEADREVAQVKFEIKLESGRVIKPSDDFTIDFGVENALAIEADGSNHEISLLVQRKGDKDKSKEVSITIGYGRDGEPIVAPYTFDAKVKKREVIRIEGGMAIALTVTPKKIKAENAPKTEEEELPPDEVEPPRSKIELDEDEDDPLGGLGKK